MPEVIERVRQELGDDAVILHIKQRKGLWWWLRRLPSVRVWAALGTKTAASHVPERTDGAPPIGDGTEVKERREKSAPKTRLGIDAAPMPLQRTPSPDKRDEKEGLHGEEAVLPSKRSKARRRPSASSPKSKPALNRVGESEREALTELSLRVERQLQLLTATLWQREGISVATKALHILWQCGVDLETLQNLCERLTPPRSGDGLRAWLHQWLCAHLPVTGGTQATTQVAVLVGPTGVGKTTTAAKIAAHQWMHHRRRVALVTVDVFRIGAVQQLETYARLMGLPFFVAQVPEEAQRCIQQARQMADLVLVDTIGRSPKQTDQLSALWELVVATNPQEVYLTLPANGNPADLMLAAEQFGIFCPTSLIVTKLDEATQPGVLVSLTQRLRLPIAYITVGQNVPDDLEIPTPDRLATWVLAPVAGRLAEVTGDA